MYKPILLAVCVMLMGGPAWAVSVAEPDGQALYEQHCAKCHDTVARAPKFRVMQKLPPEFIVRSLEVGRMLFQGVMRTKVERLAIAAYISEKDFGTARDDQAAPWTYCSLLPGQLDLSEQTANWNGWGGDITNARFQSAAKAGLAVEDIPNLKLKWSFGLPENYQTSQPTVFGGRVYIGSMKGVVFSLNAKTGCLYWAYSTGAGVRSTLTVGLLEGDPPRYAAYFGDVERNVYALDARTGKLIWKTQIEQHPTGRITGGPVLHDNRLYVGLSSFEEGSGGEPDYECCTFRGSVSALNATSGELVWKSYTVDEPKKSP
jgi:polyvinyl alcohol dehydrogenase (cytochrome)